MLEPFFNFVVIEWGAVKVKIKAQERSVSEEGFYETFYWFLPLSQEQRLIPTNPSSA